MRPRALIRLLGLLLAGGISAGAAAPRLPDADEQLLHSARVWEARDRGDLAILALEKLVAARPSQPDILLRLGELHLRLGDIAAARRVLDRLQKQFADAPVARTFAAEYRIKTRDRLQLASVERLIQVGRSRDAAAALDELFPEGAPQGALGIDYYRLLARLPGGRDKSTAGLRRLAATFSEDPRYLLAIARHLLQRPDSEQEGLRMLFVLAERDDLRRADMDDALRSAVRSVGYSRVPQRELQAYLRRFPSEQSAVQSALAAAGRDKAGTAATDQADQDSSEEHRESERAAGYWAAQAQLHEADRPALAAAERTAAAAFRQGEFEAAIRSATAAGDAGGNEQAREMLATAHRLKPQSNWIFTSYVRWLASHAHVDEALALVDSRPLGGEWTPDGRADLMAYALDQRAQAELIEGGGEAEALADLETASALAPGDPWIRYHLAQRYAASGDGERGRNLLAAGVRAWPGDTDARYALALYLSNAGAFEESLAAVDGIPPQERTPGMAALRTRAQIAMLRTEWRRLWQAGDIEGARAELRRLEPLIDGDLRLAREVAAAWIELGDAEHGLGLVRSQRDARGPQDRDAAFAWAGVLDDAGETTRLREAIGKLRAFPAANAEDAQRIDALQKSLDLREVRALEKAGNFPEAERALDAMLSATPRDRSLRITRADLDVKARHAVLALDRYAELLAEDPDDLDTRLSYVRALTEAGQPDEARRQLENVIEHVPADDFDLNLSVARRQLALGDVAAAEQTLREVTERAQARGASETVSLARAAGERIEEHRQSLVTGGVEVRHKPGDAGISLFDSLQVPTEWRYAAGYDTYYLARADVVRLDAGTLPRDFATAALLGTVQATGPGSIGSLLDPKTAQTGVSLGVGYHGPTIQADIGTTPLGFLLTNVVGGVKWTPTLGPIDLSVEFSRRALTSSVLSYAGLRDPVSGRNWGGVLQTGPAVVVGHYDSEYSLSGSLRYARLTGQHVVNNNFAGLRIAGDRKVFAIGGMRAYVGGVLTYWDYSDNLLGYTYGSGGYYSPQSYLNLSLPLEVIGEHARWSYRARVAVAYSRSHSSAMVFYPQDPALQAAATTQPLPPGYDRPVYEGGSSSGISYSVYAAIERVVIEGLVLGATLDIDRADFYKPTTFMFYARHAFGSRTRITAPPRPLDLYSDY